MSMNPHKKMENETSPSPLMGSDPSQDAGEPIVFLEESHLDAPAPKKTGPVNATRYGVAVAEGRVTIVSTEMRGEKLHLLEVSGAEIGGDSAAATTLALRDAAKRLGASPRSVDLVLPPSMCEYQVVSLPPMDRKGQSSYFSQLASKALRDRDAVFSILPLSSGAIASDVLLVAAPRDEVEALVKACHRAGMIPERAVPALLPSLALLSRQAAGIKDPIVLVDQLYREEVNLIVWDEERLRVHRNIRKSTGSDRWEEFLDSEVYRTIAYYRTQSGGKRVNRLYLAAGEDAPAMQQRFEAVGMFEAGVRRLEIENLEGESDPLAALAAGATAIQDAACPSLDLLPRELLNPRRRQFFTAVSLALGLLGIAGELFAWHAASKTNEKRQEALIAATEYADALAGYEEDFRAVEAQKAAFKSRVDEFDKLRKSRVPLSRAVAAVLSIRMDQVYLRSFNLQTSGKNGAFEIVLQGAADNNYSRSDTLQIEKYLKALEKIPGVRKPVERITKSPGSPTHGSTQREEFEIRLVFPTELTPQ